MTMQDDLTTIPDEVASDAIAPTSDQPEAAATPAPEPTPEAAPEPVTEPVAEVAAASTPAPVEKKAAPAASDDDLFMAAMAELDSEGSAEANRRLNKNERIEATVIQVEKERVFVDLGRKSEGVVPLNELAEGNPETAVGIVNVGDKIMVVVINPTGNEGNPIVSKKKADFEATWYKVIDSFEKGEVIHAPIVERVKGGLVADIGVRGFVPATHVGNGKLRNIDKYVGETMELKIIELDRERKKVVLSNRQAEDEKRGEVKDRIFNEVNPGDVLEGTVRRLSDYGAFVDLGGIDGLLHISEMSWMRIQHPKEVLKEGQEVKVMVLRLDSGNGKISLGLRQVLPDPWNLIKENYKIGQKLTAKVGRLVQSGAFIRLPEGAEAFLPVSEISTRRINKPADVLEQDQEIEVAVIDLRTDERRMVLSLRAAGNAIEPPEDYVADTSYESDRPRMGSGTGPRRKPGMGGGGRGRRDDGAGDVPSVSSRQPSGGATIGERLGMLKGLLSKGSDEPTTDGD